MKPKKIKPQNLIKDWNETLVRFQEQASRSYIKETDLIPLWLGASDADCVEWIKEEIRLIKKQSGIK